jgi:integrase
MFNRAVEWKWRPDNPVKGIERYEEQKRDRWLSDNELRRLCTVLDEYPNTPAANAVRLQPLTGARLGEVLTSRKEDFDLQRGVWDQALASDRAKANRAFAAQHPGGSADRFDNRDQRCGFPSSISRKQAWSAAA